MSVWMEQRSHKQLHVIVDHCVGEGGAQRVQASIAEDRLQENERWESAEQALVRDAITKQFLNDSST